MLKGEGSRQEEVSTSSDNRAVWIALAIRERGMLAMARYPLLRDDRRGHPEPESHRKCSEVVKLYAAVRLRPMQKKCDRHIGEVSGDYNKQNRFPPVCGPASEIRHYEYLRCSFSSDNIFKSIRPHRLNQPSQARVSETFHGKKVLQSLA